MTIFQRAWRSVLRKPIKSGLLFLLVGVISLSFLSAMASGSATLATQDSTRQAIGSGFLLERNAQNRSQRLAAASEKIAAAHPDGQGSADGVHQEKTVVGGEDVWRTWTDHRFETLPMQDIKRLAQVDGIADYTVTTVPTAVRPLNMARIEDADADQTYDLGGVALVGNREMALDANVLSGNVTLKEGRLVTPDDKNVCVISEALAEKNRLKCGDTLRFSAVKKETDVSATVVGIYQTKEAMQPYMSGDTYRSENVIFTDLSFPENVEQEGPLYEKAYFKVADVNAYDEVKAALQATDIDWENYDLIDKNGNLETMAANFNNLAAFSKGLMVVIAVAGWLILVLVFAFWLKGRQHEVGIWLSLGHRKRVIWAQLVLEALMIGVCATGSAFLAAPAVVDVAAQVLVTQQSAQEAAAAEAESGQVASDYEAPMLTVLDVQTTLSPRLYALDGVAVGGLLVLAVSAGSILLLRRHPRDILQD